MLLKKSFGKLFTVNTLIKIYSGGCITFFLFFIIFGFSSHRNRLRQIKEEIKQLRKTDVSRRLDLEDEAKKRQQLEERLKILTDDISSKQKIKIAEVKILNIKDIPDWAGKITSNSIYPNVEFISLKLETVIKEGSYQRLPMDLNIKCRFKDFINYLQDLEEKVSFGKISSISLATNQDIYPRLNVHLVVNIPIQE